MPRRPPTAASLGLPGLRGGSVLPELLFLYDCATEEPTRLRPIADRLGVTVQAISHSYLSLSRRGLVQFQEGRYRPTVQGTAWLHRALGTLAEDVFARQRRLRTIRSCRALALTDIRGGETVSLELVEGLLSARPGSGSGSKGIATADARAGALVEVDQLEGILPMTRAPIRVLAIPADRLRVPTLARELERAIDGGPVGLLAAQGVEASLFLRRATRSPFVRFAPGAAALDASRVGVPSTVVVLDEELPRLLAQFDGQGSLPLTVETLSGSRRTIPHRRRGGRGPA